MSQVILLTDTILWGEIGNGRYAGAYAIAAELRKNNITTTVIDYFTRHPDFFSYIDEFVTEKTVAIGIASTFLSPQHKNQQFSQRTESIRDFNSGALWLKTYSELEDWLVKFKSRVKKKSPNIKIVLGGVKSQNALKFPQHYSNFDYAVLGPADKTFTQFIKNLISGYATDFFENNGIRYLNNNEDINNKICPEIIWLPQDGVQTKESLPLEIARGCIFNCKFCHYQKQESFKKY